MVIARQCLNVCRSHALYPMGDETQHRRRRRILQYRQSCSVMSSCCFVCRACSSAAFHQEAERQGSSCEQAAAALSVLGCINRLASSCRPALPYERRLTIHANIVIDRLDEESYSYGHTNMQNPTKCLLIQLLSKISTAHVMLDSVLKD